MNRRILLIFLFLFLLVGIPIAIYMVQQQQVTRSKAVKSSTLSFTPNSTQSTPLAKKVGDAFSVDVMLDPGENNVQAIELHIEYDATKLEVNQSTAVQINSAAFAEILEAPIFTPGKIITTISTGNDPTKAVEAPTKVATITFTAKDATEAKDIIKIGNDAQVWGVGAQDEGYGTSVLSSTTPLFVAIAATAPPASEVTTAPETTTAPEPTTIALVQPSTTPTATPAPTRTVGSSQPTTTPTAAPTLATAQANKLPSCTGLNADRATTGVAPLAITFTAIGNDSDGTISQVSFNFGDGPETTVTQGGGIGTKAVNLPTAHTFTKPGSYLTSVVLTDDDGAMSGTVAACTKTVVVQAAAVGQSAPTNTPTPTRKLTPTAVPTLIADLPAEETAPLPTLTPPGPGNIYVGLSIFFGIVTIIGGLIFLAL